MNLLDFVIILTMAFLVVRGVFRGFLRELGSIVGVILGIWLASVYEPQVTGYLKNYVPSAHALVLQLLSFASIFIVVLISCNLMAWGLKLLFQKALLGWADRSLGGALAVLKGIIITYLFIVLLTFFIPGKAPLIATSKLAPLTIASYQSLVSVVSSEHYKEWKRKFLEDGGSRQKDAPSNSTEKPEQKNGP